MSKDQAIGAMLLGGSILAILVYLYLLMSPWWEIIVKLTLSVVIAAFLLIIAWIGYTLMTTPPPQSLEEIEKETEKEVKDND